MVKPCPQSVSLNPTAPAFSYKPSSPSRSNSFSSSSATSSSDTESNTSSQGTLHTTTSASSFHPTLPPKEFIPRSNIISLDSMGTFTAETSPVGASDSPSDDQCSESQLSIGGNSNPSDTTFSTQDGFVAKTDVDSKVEDLLLSMKLHAIEFSQGYYFKRASELGISLPLSPPSSSTIDIFPRKSAFNDSYEWKSNPTKSVTVCARSFRNPSKHRDKSQRSSLPKVTKSIQQRPPPSDGRGIGSVWDGYVSGENLPARKVGGNLREWEWEDPVPETIMDVQWSEEDEEPRASKKSLGPSPSVKIGGGNQVYMGEVKQSIEGKKVVGGGKGVGVVAPRGKSWMIVTQRMMEEYTP